MLTRGRPSEGAASTAEPGPAFRSGRDDPTSSHNGPTGPRLVEDGMPAAAIMIDVTDLVSASARGKQPAGGSASAAVQLGAASIVSLNGAAVELLQVRSDRLDVLTPASIWPHACLVDLADLVLSGEPDGAGIRRSVQLKTLDGTTVPGILSARLARPGGERVLLITQFVDARGLEPVVEGLSYAVASQHSLFRNLPLGLCRVNGDRLTSFYESLGIGPGADVQALLRSRPDVVERAAELCVIEEVNSEAVRILGARSADDLVGRAVGFAWRETPERFAETLAAGVLGLNQECQVRLSRLDGGTSEVILASASVREDGRRASIIGMVDIGDRLSEQADLIRLQAQFAQSYRLSLLGEVSGWFAHEISQPLAAIVAAGMSGRRWLDRSEPVIDEARVALDRVVAYAVRSSGIIDRLREMAWSHAPDLCPESLGAVVGAAMPLVEAEARAADVSIFFRSGSGEDLVAMDRNQIGRGEPGDERHRGVGAVGW